MRVRVICAKKRTAQQDTVERKGDEEELSRYQDLLLFISDSFLPALQSHKELIDIIRLYLGLYVQSYPLRTVRMYFSCIRRMKNSEEVEKKKKEERVAGELLLLFIASMYSFH